MSKRVPFARTLVARAFTARVVAVFSLALIGLASSTAWSEPTDIRWGTGPAGSSGGKALVVLANILNKEGPLPAEEADAVRRAYPQLEIEIQNGGQPNYPFILSIE